MANITSRLLTGSVDSIVLRAPNGTSLVRLPVERTPNSHVYVSQHAMNPVVGAYYLQVRYIYILMKFLYKAQQLFDVHYDPIKGLEYLFIFPDIMLVSSINRLHGIGCYTCQ